MVAVLVQNFVADKAIVSSIKKPRKNYEDQGTVDIGSQ